MANNIDVAWAAGPGNPAGTTHKLERQTRSLAAGSASTYAEIASTTGLSHTDTNVGRLQYRYRVRASLAGRTPSGYRESRWATVNRPPDIPSTISRGITEGSRTYDLGTANVASDPDGDTLTYNLSSEPDGWEVDNKTGNITYNGGTINYTPQTSTIQFTLGVEDQYGSASFANVVVTVNPVANQSPTMNALRITMSEGETQTWDLTGYSSDDGGTGNLTYNISGLPPPEDRPYSTLLFDTNRHKLQIAAHTRGTYEFMISCTDKGGRSDSATWRLVIERPVGALSAPASISATVDFGD